MKPSKIRMSKHGKPVHTVFDLLGQQENDITAAIGWSMSICPEFLQRFLKICGVTSRDAGSVEFIDLQRHGADRGFTDIEMSAERFHLILEAKCGWNLPTKEQLGKYARRFKCAASRAVLVAISECTEEYVAANHLHPRVAGCRVVYVSYRELRKLAIEVHGRCRNASRRILSDLVDYLGKIMATAARKSNMVYVVSLGKDTPHYSSLSWIAIVEKTNRYFHPVGGKGWPAEPVGYLGFRYHGELQSVRYVEKYVMAPDGKAMHAEIPEINAKAWDKARRTAHEPHFIYRLGPAVRPEGVVKSGNRIRATRLWAAIDLLLTSKSVTEAAKRTKRRDALSEKSR